MSKPVVTNKWAGTFDCGTCRRKRLMGEEFSKKALERHRKDDSPLKCKQCVAAAEKLEREKAEARRKKDSSGEGALSIDITEETRACSGSCGKTLSQSSFNRNQWAKGEGKSRCRECVEKSVQEEGANQSKAKDDKIMRARQDVEDAKASGDSSRIVTAESVVAALEAEKVTGLKPIKLGRGRGRGVGGRGRGRGRR